MSVLSKFNIALLFISIINLTHAQGLSDELKGKVESSRHVRIMFYNCENLFDIYDDTLKNDTEFLPEGAKHWDKTKYYKKINNISKVITAVGGWVPPELVGLCEVENKKVLFDLTMNSPLRHSGYKVIHRESPDRRGIDVALLYQPQKYTPIKNRYIQIDLPTTHSGKTRDILYSKGVLYGSDTIHLFVTHWPSRWGGHLETESSRLHVASVLRVVTDSIVLSSTNANIVIMGDFNDEPKDNSLVNGLNVGLSIENQNYLFNMSSDLNSFLERGTIKYRGVWSIFDQLIVSRNLLGNNSSLFTKIGSFTIFDAEFLLEKDEKYLGYKPFRTYVGYRFNGGYSDHLPIFIDLHKH